MAVVSFGFQFKAFLCETFMLSTYLYRVSLDIPVSSHSPDVYAWALNDPTGCFPALLSEVQLHCFSWCFSICQDHTKSWPFLWFLLNSWTNPSQLFTLNMDWTVCDYFFMKWSHICQWHQSSYVHCCTSKGPVSVGVRQQQLAIKQDHSFPL